MMSNTCNLSYFVLIYRPATLENCGFRDRSCLFVRITSRYRPGSRPYPYQTFEAASSSISVHFGSVVQASLARPKLNTL
jgi:hypothetical protein